MERCTIPVHIPRAIRRYARNAERPIEDDGVALTEVALGVFVSFQISRRAWPSGGTGTGQATP